MPTHAELRPNLLRVFGGMPHGDLHRSVLVSQHRVELERRQIGRNGLGGARTVDVEVARALQREHLHPTGGLLFAA